MWGTRVTHVRQTKIALDDPFHVVNSGFQEVDSGFLSVELGFRIPFILKFENPRRGRKARNFATNVPKILNFKSFSEQIFFEN